MNVTPDGHNLPICSPGTRVPLQPFCKKTMKYLPPIVLCTVLVSTASLGCGGAAEPSSASTTPTEGSPSADLTDAQRGKLDPRLASRYEEGREPFPVKVRFTSVPSDAVLAELLLTRVGATVVGQVDRAGLERILAREDVEEVSYVSGAGYDDEDAG